MSSLEISPFVFREGTFDYTKRQGCSGWRLALEGEGDEGFPSNERMAELWHTHVPALGELSIVHRDGDPLCRILIFEIPKGTTPKKRAPFMEALMREIGLTP